MGLTQSLAENLRKPSSGFVGRIVTKILKKGNEATELSAVRLCRLEPHHRVLEIGFGPGLGLKAAVDQIGDDGKVYGIDFSPAMVAEASRLLSAAIASGKVELTLGDAARLPYDAASMDRLYHCNCYYFWPDPPAVARELRRVLRPGGFMVTTLSLRKVEAAARDGYLPNTHWQPQPYMETLRAAGFTDVAMEDAVYKEGNKETVCQAIVAHKKE